ncbi:MAG: RNA polymerase sigma factor [Saprospiraceae bacterium]
MQAELMTDETILELIRLPGKREDGFKQLVIKYQERLYHAVRNRLTSHEDADDVLQNAFLKIFRHIDSFEGRSEIFTWMYRICINEVSNHQKKNSRIKIMEINQTEAVAAEPYMDSVDVADSLEKAVSGLPERQQMVFRMRYFDELSYKQIAELLQVTEGALKASFHHAVRKIEEEFRSKQIL